MKVLFDQGTPAPLRRYLRTHEVTTVYELGWSTLQNGFLLSQAEAAGFNVLITTDKNWKYQPAPIHFDRPATAPKYASKNGAYALLAISLTHLRPSS